MTRPDYFNDPAAKPALDALGREKWRQARDRAKELCKKDRVCYLPLLIEANTGLAREMLSRQLLSEAKTVIEYLATIAPAEIVKTLQQELLGASAGASLQARPTSAPAKVDPDAARLQMLQFKWVALQELAQRFQISPALSKEDYCLIDETVCFFEMPRVVSPEPAAQKLATELAAVHETAAAAADGNREVFRQRLRKIPASSIFRHWRIFLKGFEHSVHGEPSEARTSFAGLPQSEFLPRLIDVIEGKPPRNFLPKRTLAHWWLSVCGADPGYSVNLVQVDSAWHSGKWGEALFLLKNIFGRDFGRQSPGVEFAISDSVLTPPENPESGAQSLWENAHDFVESVMLHQGSPMYNKDDILRTMVLSCWHFLSPENLRFVVEQIIEIRQKRGRANPLRNAVWLAWLGQKLAADEPLGLLKDLQRIFLRKPGKKAPKDRLIDAPGAVRALTSAIALDPSDVQSALLLHRVYMDMRKTKEANRLIDRLCNDFPENKQILMLQGNICVDRKAFIKAAENFRKALNLDPLDKQARRFLLTSLLEHALKSRKNPEAFLDSDLWEEIHGLADRDPGSARALWALRLRRALIARDIGMLQEIRKEAPSPTHYLFAAGVIAECWRTDLPFSVQIAQDCEWADLLTLVNLGKELSECRELGISVEGCIDEVMKHMLQPLECREKIARNPAAFVDFVESLKPLLLAEIAAPEAFAVCHEFTNHICDNIDKSAGMQEEARRAVSYAFLFLEAHNFTCAMNPFALRDDIHKEIRRLTKENDVYFIARYHALLEYLKQFPGGEAPLPPPRKPGKKRRPGARPSPNPAANQLDLHF